MAQTLAPTVGAPGGLGSQMKLKFSVWRLTNTAAETTFTLTAAALGLAAFVAFCIDESAAAAVRANPTVDAVSGLFTSVALTFTAGDELTILVIGI